MHASLAFHLLTLYAHPLHAFYILTSALFSCLRQNKKKILSPFGVAYTQLTQGWKQYTQPQKNSYIMIVVLFLMNTSFTVIVPVFVQLYVYASSLPSYFLCS